MIAPKIAVLMSDARSSSVVALLKYVAQNGPSGAWLVSVTSTPPKVPKAIAKTSKRLVTRISARKRGTTRFLIGSTPRTISASSSSRILRAPRSAQIAVPVKRAEQVEEARGLDPSGAVGKRDRRDDHRQPRDSQREQELRQELA